MHCGRFIQHDAAHGSQTPLWDGPKNCVSNPVRCEVLTAAHYITNHLRLSFSRIHANPNLHQESTGSDMEAA